MEKKQTKTCCICKKEKQLMAFHKTKGKKYGVADQCKLCAKKYKQQYYEDNKEKVKNKCNNWRKNNKEKMKLAVNKRNKKLKEKRVKEKGGKCQICGYDKSIAALEFHHVNSTEKENVISRLTLRKAKEELKKCILICSNCHREIHNINY